MHSLRVILVVLIASSVAMVPAAAGAVCSTMPVEMSMLDHADMPCSNVPDDCKGSVACALKCFNFVGAIQPHIIILALQLDSALPSFANGALHPHVSSPPTHPPPA
jgi:hypothetical protein